ncbi:MAG TPA: PEP-CTERM sorting domain-containing protein [Tepidisphaeraceae bacterium]|jgi:hypothetical protein|nr:PEP-CTERM sorting domain-containing protein [Tepidisphaeraceae bacterium]
MFLGKWFNIATFGLLSVATTTGATHAAVLTLNSNADVTIVSRPNQDYFNAANYGARNDLQINSYAEYNTLQRFDTAGLAALTGATINSVTLNFTVATGNTATFNNANLKLAQLTAANSGWQQGNGGGQGSFSSSGATLYLANRTAGTGYEGNPGGTGTAWASSSAGGPLVNFYAADQFQGNAATVYTFNGTTGTYAAGTTFSLTLNNNVVTNWMSDPNLAAAGLLLIANGGGVSGGVFASSETGSGPTVTIDYTAAAVPEPTAMAVLGLGAAIAMVRKRTRTA